MLYYNSLDVITYLSIMYGYDFVNYNNNNNIQNLYSALYNP